MLAANTPFAEIGEQDMCAFYKLAVATQSLPVVDAVAILVVRARCHWRSHRQFVMLLLQPSSWCSFHKMPVKSTNSMPLKTTRSSTRGHSLLNENANGGINLLISARFTQTHDSAAVDSSTFTVLVVALKAHNYNLAYRVFK